MSGRHAVLFSTPHGSHLYGLATPTSDRDTYAVVTRAQHVPQRSRARYARQTIDGAEDTFTIDLSTWLLLCAKGVPQALEAMWSQAPTVDRIGAFRAAYRATPAVLPTYERTIASFIRAGDFKRRRHALRLALNARDIAHHGRFNPTLTPQTAETITVLAEGLAPEYALEHALAVMHGRVMSTS